MSTVLCEPIAGGEPLDMAAAERRKMADAQCHGGQCLPYDLLAIGTGRNPDKQHARGLSPLCSEDGLPRPSRNVLTEDGLPRPSRNALADGAIPSESNQQPETVTVNLSQAQQGQYILGSPASATVTVAEQPIPTVTIAGGVDAVEEGAGGEFTVTRTGPFTAPLTVSYTVGGSAVAGGDYQTLSGTVTIPAGSDTTVVAVTPLDDGATDDPPQSQLEQVTLTLSTSTTYVVGNASTATIGIDEEPPPSVTIVADSDATEAGDSGEFDVVRTGPVDAPLTVTYTVSGSATAGNDYEALTGTVTIPAGGEDATISVDPLDDGDGDDGASP